MITDPKRIRLADPGHPHECNVYAWWRVFAPERAPEIEAGCKGAKFGCVQCKKWLAEVLAERLRPIRDRRKELLADPKALDAVLERGRERAGRVARETMGEVWEAIRFVL
jgi:tryptophanyl-tRNA synthetase